MYCSAEAQIQKYTSKKLTTVDLWLYHITISLFKAWQTDAMSVSRKNGFDGAPVV